MILEKEMLIKGVMLWNLVAFIVMAYDKYAAVKKLRRVQEKHIFALALFLAAAGVYWGILIFRHKTLHLSFRLGIRFIGYNIVPLLYYLLLLNLQVFQYGFLNN